MRITYLQSIAFFITITLMVLPTACEDKEEEEPDMTIGVTGGTSPVFSWSFNKSLQEIADPPVNNVTKVSVRQYIVGGSITFWTAKDTLDDQNGIYSPIKYGSLPQGAIEPSEADPLVEGDVYIVVLTVDVQESYESHSSEYGHNVIIFDYEFSP